MIYQLQFWVLVAGLAAYVAKYLYPDLPLGEAEILAGILFLLGLIGVVPQVRARGLVASDLFNSKAFWTLVVGVVGFVVRFFAPEFPYNDVVILAVVIFFLNQIGINPELRRLYLLEYDEDF